MRTGTASGASRLERCGSSGQYFGLFLEEEIGKKTTPWRKKILKIEMLSLFPQSGSAIVKPMIFGDPVFLGQKCHCFDWSCKNFGEGNSSAMWMMNEIFSLEEEGWQITDSSC